MLKAEPLWLYVLTAANFITLTHFDIALAWYLITERHNRH